jgi:hypothetical protein
VTAAQYPDLLVQNFGASRVEAILKQYPLSDYPTPSYAFIQAMSDSAQSGNNRTGACNVLLADQLASPHTPVSFLAYPQSIPHLVRLSLAIHSWRTPPVISAPKWGVPFSEKKPRFGFICKGHAVVLKREADKP